ncbi:MAG: hypothetical protein JJ897_00975 [Marinibacterium sp.]|nr:hypothetical protein [Marinibacterium sp.]
MKNLKPIVLSDLILAVPAIATAQFGLGDTIGTSDADIATLDTQFDQWGLVAVLSIKGLSIAEIATMRNTREGTVKAQNAALYRKAVISGRPQLLSLCIADLMTGSVVKPED